MRKNKFATKWFHYFFLLYFQNQVEKFQFLNYFILELIIVEIQNIK